MKDCGPQVVSPPPSLLSPRTGGFLTAPLAGVLLSECSQHEGRSCHIYLSPNLFSTRPYPSQLFFLLPWSQRIQKPLPLLFLPCFLCLPLLPSPFLSFLLFLFHTLIGFTLHFLLLLSTLPLVQRISLTFLPNPCLRRHYNTVSRVLSVLKISCSKCRCQTNLSVTVGFYSLWAIPLA